MGRAGWFWGGVASLFLLQAFGYVTFNAFLLYLQEGRRQLYFGLWGGLWVLFFMLFQADAISVMRKRLSGGVQVHLIPEDVGDFSKLLMSLIFLAILFTFSLGYYPFDEIEHDNLQLAVFYAVSWLMSVFLARMGTHFIVLRAKNRLTGVVICGLVAALTIHDRLLFYTAGLVGLGFMTALLTTWLSE